MRIAMITGWFLSKDKGSGASVFIQELKTGLEERGAEVDLITPQLRGVSNYYLATIARIIKNYFLAFKDFKKYDLIVGFDYDGFKIPRISATPKIGMPRAVMKDVFSTEKGFSKMFVGWQAKLEKENVASSDFIISNSHYSKGKIEKLYGISAEKIKVIHTGIDINKRLPPIKEFEKKQDGIIRFLSVGKMYPRKNIPFLLELFENICRLKSNCELHIVGDGIDFNRVRKLKDKMKAGGKVKLYGYVSDPEKLRKIYAHSDIVCHFAEQEAFGNVILEALALGKPVFAFNKASLPEQIKNGHNGLLFENNDPPSIAIEINDLLDQKDRLKEMEKKCTVLIGKIYQRKNARSFPLIFSGHFI